MITYFRELLDTLKRIEVELRQIRAYQQQMVDCIDYIPDSTGNAWIRVNDNKYGG